MIRKGLKYLLFLSVMATLFLPLTETLTNLLPSRPLNGSFDVAPEPEFSLEEWTSGAYQIEYEKHLNDHVGGREHLVRMRNQYYFSAYQLAMANGVVPGKNGVLLDYDYVDAFYGKDFVGEAFLTDKLRRWKRVERGLDSIGVKAALVLVPGKASYFEDDFSEKLIDEHQPNTNYGFIADWAGNNQIRLLDLKKLYHTWVDTSRYPLFPKGGIHWSEYGIAHVCDTLRGYIQTLTGRPLQKFWFDVELSDTARRGDNDIADGMNLWFTPNKEKLAYPYRYFGEDSTIAPTRLLTIADSYYYGIIYSGFADRVCSYGGFWYYFKESHPFSLFGTNNVEELDILEELKKQDVLLLMMTEPQLTRFGWDSVEKLEEVLYPTN
ncbi:MAG: hypothetical protein JKX84_01740 [Flavobacteriales bacterium]|nr:hypothetical protein [Flavobacteriales bacterium]